MANAFYALSGNNLLSFDHLNPSAVATTAITGVNGSETLVGIDFRPNNGMLYGLGVNAAANTATLYLISQRTGFATSVGTVGQVALTTDGSTPVDLPDPATVGWSFDFNPAADRIRVTTGSGLNFRINPNTGAAVDGDNGGAVTTGVNPDGPISGAGVTGVEGTAYTNNQPNHFATTLYTLDATSNALLIQNPPNAGTQTLATTVTLNGSTLDFTGVNGFDIWAGVNTASNNTPVATGLAFAVLNVGGLTGLYGIDLVNGVGVVFRQYRRRRVGDPGPRDPQRSWRLSGYRAVVRRDDDRALQHGNDRHDDDAGAEPRESGVRRATRCDRFPAADRPTLCARHRRDGEYRHALPARPAKRRGEHCGGRNGQ